jgi:hypothetical protein
MHNDEPPVWECEHEVLVSATPAVVWSVFRDVAAWKDWNPGVQHTELQGAFLPGSRIIRHEREGVSITRLIEVNEPHGFVVETRLNDVRVFVDHRLERLSEDRTRVVYSLEAFGPSCEQVGAAIAAAFPETLRGLGSRAESLMCEAV